jgi:hypothetical protein
MKNPKIFSAVLFVVGFAILIANAVDYLGGFFGLSWEYHLPSSAIGIVFIVVGMYQMWLYEGSKTAENKKT